MGSIHAGLVCALPLALAVAGPVGAEPLAVEDVPFTDSTETYSVDMAYPRTGDADIDAAIANWAVGLANDFIKQAREDFADFEQGGDRPMWTYALDLAYGVARNDDDMFVVDFNQSVFTGGAHPNPGIRTFNFLRQDGWQVLLPEIFEPAALQTISDLAIADLQGSVRPRTQ